MGLPNYAHEYSEAAELDWALERFHQALRARLFEGVRHGKRGWQNLEGALERAEHQMECVKVAATTDDRSRELLDTAAYVFMEWWRT